jgi:7-carboxy-7-deazaguanine synthase
MKTDIFPIVELFDSIDGEGKRTGYMAVFVRFAGCNLRCSYCDTSYAWNVSDAAEYLTEEQLLGRIHQYPWKRITLTGGEPMLQPIEHLCQVLGEEGYDINIETNGSIPLFAHRPKGVFYTMDLKTPSSGVRESMCKDNLALLNQDDVVKFVVGTHQDLLDMEETLQTTSIPAQIYVSPVYGQIAPAELVDFVKAHKLTRVCVQIQLHKVIWDPATRGV